METGALVQLFCMFIWSAWADELSPHIVVVGAGAAGLAATNRLLENGFQVTLLEASNRVGGRVWSVPVEGLNGTVELGAECLLNMDNEIYAWALSNGLVKPDNAVFETADLFPSDGIPLTNAEFSVVQETLDWLTDVHFYPNYWKRFTQNSKTMSIGQLLQLGYVSLRPSSAQSAVSDAVYEFIVRSQRADNAVQNLFQLGYGQIDHISQTKIPQCLKVSATQLLLQFAPQAAKVLRLNTLVSSINLDRTAEKPLQVTTYSGVTFGADHVVVTSSLGFLKNNMASLFSPALSLPKQNAIKSAGYGSTEKIVAAYPNAWWGNVSSTLSEAMLLRRSSSARSIKKDTPEAAKDWTDEIVRFNVSKTVPNALVFSFAGRVVGFVDQLSDAQIMTDLTKMLTNFFPSVSFPSPTGVYRAKWSTNKLSLGTSSYFSAQYAASNYTMAALAAPDRQFAYSKVLHGKTRSVPGLLFAGEATSPHDFGTMHGALLSGVREANRISMIYS